MKTLKRIFFVSTALVLFAVADSNAQVFVKTRLTHHGPAIVKPPRPSDHHVWIGEEWTVKGKTYVEHPAHWAAKPFINAIWMPGYWSKFPKGYGWVQGYWR